MKVLEFEDNKIEIFNSAESMPMKRYQRFNKFLMIDNEVGSDFNDFNRRSVKAIEYLKKGMKDEAIKELENRRQMVYNSFVEYSPKGRAFAILVHKINGEEFSDYSKDGLDLIMVQLDKIGFTQYKMEVNLEDVKKKYKKNWFLTFLESLRT